MLICRITTFLLLTLTLGVFAFELYNAILKDSYTFIKGGDFWSRIHTNSLVGFGSLIENKLSPWLWGNIILPILLAPAWSIPAVPTIIFVTICKHGDKKAKSKWRR